MAMPIVDALEVVDVDGQQGIGAPRAGMPRGLGAQQALQRPPAKQTGQRVVIGLIFQPAHHAGEDHCHQGAVEHQAKEHGGKHQARIAQTGLTDGRCKGTHRQRRDHHTNHVQHTNGRQRQGAQPGRSLAKLAGQQAPHLTGVAQQDEGQRAGNHQEKDHHRCVRGRADQHSRSASAQHQAVFAIGGLAAGKNLHAPSQHDKGADQQHIGQDHGQPDAGLAAKLDQQHRSRGQPGGRRPVPRGRCRNAQTHRPQPDGSEERLLHEDHGNEQLGVGHQLGRRRRA
jgi:hypothetical protein